MSVRTRFAPSPTGYLHIGGVRTALFNWLFARHHGGQFILRIDDTDQERNLDAALAPILAGFRWLGIDWDEGPEVGGAHGPYYQSQRQRHYQAAVEKLVAMGAAYRDYAHAEEVAEEREAAERANQPFVYSRRWMAEGPRDDARWTAEGRKPVVRLKMPRQGKLAVRDLIRGLVEFDWAREQDHVIQRADGTCLYHLATVVDDFDFQISHVIRAEEHLSNTPRQVFMAESLGYRLPEFAHLPLVAEPGSRGKLSKRKLDKYLKNPDFAAVALQGQRIAERLGRSSSAETFNPVIVDFYQQTGYLPDALLNYLLLLGWSLDDKSEYFSREEMIRRFSLDRVNLDPASFDQAKLDAFQLRYMRALPLEQKVAFVLPFLHGAGLIPTPPSGDALATLRAILRAAGDRVKVAGDILEFDDFFLADDQLPYDEKAFDKALRQHAEAADLVARFQSVLRDVDPYEPAEIEQALARFAAVQGIKIGQIVHALRVAVTGKGVGFGLFDTLAILGKNRTLARIDRALGKLELRSD
jgi:glutamyl-tRNA synthetase